MMTEERVNQIADAITAYDDTAKLFEMSPEDAVAELNLNGNDFTLDEIKEVGESLKTVALQMNESDELNETALNHVSGGVYVDRYVILACGCIAIAAVCGW